jgi:hypothetical protein
MPTGSMDISGGQAAAWCRPDRGGSWLEGGFLQFPTNPLLALQHGLYESRRLSYTPVISFFLRKTRVIFSAALADVAQL